MNNIEEFDCVVVGGGIVGAGIFRDLCLHQEKSLIIDKADFTAKTSQASSKMLHGGIRYLENLDFHLVYEALHEKNLWLKIAPHLCYEERFYLPIYQDAKRPLWMIKLGLFLYDLLSGFQNTRHQIADKKTTLQNIAHLNPRGLSGAGIYSDAVVDDAKMTLEMIYDGCFHSPSSKALNYHEFLAIESEADGHIISIKNSLNGKSFQVKAKNIVYALGPFTDIVLSKIKKYHWQNILLPSKGSHLWFSRKRLPLQHPIVMTTKDDRVIFVIPQNDLVLVGTTELAPDKNFDEQIISEKETTYLLQELGKYFPDLKLEKNDILGSYSGIRPLVRDNSGDLGKTSREHKIVQMSSSEFAIAGGKYTTFRVMGQEITRIIVTKKGKVYDELKTTSPLKKTSLVKSFKFKIPSDQEIEQIIKDEFPKTTDDFIYRRLGIHSPEIWNEKTTESFEAFKIKIDKIFQTEL